MNDIDERNGPTNKNQFELLLFRLGSGEQNDLYGINIFKVREILEMPSITKMVGAGEMVLGIADIRGQVIPVIDLPKLVGYTPGATKPNILLVCEYSRSTQGFAVEAVEEIVRLEWNQVVSAENSDKGGLVTSVAKLDSHTDNPRLVQVLDVEQILRAVLPARQPDVDPATIGPQVTLRPGTRILAADDSAVARGLIEQGLNAIGVPVQMTKSGQEAWSTLDGIAERAIAAGKTVQDEIALVLTDLEMPEMDGFALTQKVKSDPRFRNIPVVIHSSLSGTASEDQARKVGADAYVAKFVAQELADTIRNALQV